MKVIRGITMLGLCGLLSSLPAAGQDLFFMRSGIGARNGEKSSAFGANPADLLRGQTASSTLSEASAGKAIGIARLALRTELAGLTVDIFPMTNLDLALRHADAGEFSGTLSPQGPPSPLNLHSQTLTNEGGLGVRFSF